eukprot:752454-Hanusia_phi.AAC.1
MMPTAYRDRSFIGKDLEAFAQEIALQMHQRSLFLPERSWKSTEAFKRRSAPDSLDFPPFCSHRVANLSFSPTFYLSSRSSSEFC